MKRIEYTEVVQRYADMKSIIEEIDNDSKQEPILSEHYLRAMELLKPMHDDTMDNGDFYNAELAEHDSHLWRALEELSSRLWAIKIRHLGGLLAKYKTKDKQG